MLYELNLAVEAASHNLRTVTPRFVKTGELVKLTNRLETIKRIAQFSPTVARATCQRFCDDCNVIHKRLLATDEHDPAYAVRRISIEFSKACMYWYKVAVCCERTARRGWDRGGVEPACIVRVVRVARWESRGGKHWVNLYWGQFDYHYSSNDSGGSVCSPFVDNESAVAVTQAMVDNGQFLPDKAVLPMRKVI